MTDESTPTEKHIKKLVTEIAVLEEREKELKAQGVTDEAHFRRELQVSEEARRSAVSREFEALKRFRALDQEILQLRQEVSEMARDLNTERMRVNPPGQGFSGVLE